MHYRMKIMGTISYLLITAASASAENIPEMSDYFDQKISTMEKIVCEMSLAPADPRKYTMVLQDINVDIAGTATFGINSVISLSISPEVDFILTPETQQ